MAAVAAARRPGASHHRTLPPGKEPGRNPGPLPAPTVSVIWTRRFGRNNNIIISMTYEFAIYSEMARHSTVMHPTTRSGETAAARFVRSGAAFFGGIQEYGYILARMPFDVILAPEAVDDLERLKAHIRAAVRTAFETHLGHQPGKTSRRRVKPLQGWRGPQYRLRVDDIRLPSRT